MHEADTSKSYRHPIFLSTRRSSCILPRSAFRFVWPLPTSTPSLAFLCNLGLPSYVIRWLHPLIIPLHSEFNEEQRNVFCVFSGDGVNKLRDYLNQHEEARDEYTQSPNELDESTDEQDGINGMMQSTVLDGEDYDE